MGPCGVSSLVEPVFQFPDVGTERIPRLFYRGAEISKTLRAERAMPRFAAVCRRTATVAAARLQPAKADKRQSVCSALTVILTKRGINMSIARDLQPLRACRAATKPKHKEAALRLELELEAGK